MVIQFTHMKKIVCCIFVCIYNNGSQIITSRVEFFLVFRIFHFIQTTFFIESNSEGIYVIYEKSSKQTYTGESLSFLINKVVQTNISEKCI